MLCARSSLVSPRSLSCVLSRTPSLPLPLPLPQPHPSSSQPHTHSHALNRSFSTINTPPTPIKWDYSTTPPNSSPIGFTPPSPSEEESAKLTPFERVIVRGRHPTPIELNRAQEYLERRFIEVYGKTPRSKAAVEAQAEDDPDDPPVEEAEEDVLPPGPNEEAELNELNKMIQQASFVQLEGKKWFNNEAIATETAMYTPEHLARLEKKYSWLDFNKFARHLHSADVHFFDQEVPIIDKDFTVKPNFQWIHRLEMSNRLKEATDEEQNKLYEYFCHGWWLDSGRNVRVGPEGKIQSFWSMLVAGDGNGTAAFGIGKAAEMNLCEPRALANLRRNMLFVPLHESRTISHEVIGKHGACKVRLFPRPRDQGITAGFLGRSVLECFGIKDCTVKFMGRYSPRHQILALFDALKQVKVLREEAIKRGVTAYHMFDRAVDLPPHPRREEMDRRASEVNALLREARERVLNDDWRRARNALPAKTGFYHPDANNPADWDPNASHANIAVPNKHVKPTPKVYTDNNNQPFKHGAAPNYNYGERVRRNEQKKTNVNPQTYKQYDDRGLVRRKYKNLR